MRGYLFTALTLLMFMSLFMVSYYFFVKSQLSNPKDIEAYKVAGFYSDVTSDISQILGLDVEMVKSGDPADLVISYNDRLPTSNDLVYWVSNYSSFLKNQYSLDANIGANISCPQLSSSTSAVEFMIYPVEYGIGWANMSKRSLFLRNHTMTSGPESINLTLWVDTDLIEDTIWVEAEDMSGISKIDQADSDASDEMYVMDFEQLNQTIYIPFHANYTLWVRTVKDNTSKNFTVEVDGVNSTRFDIRDYDASGSVFSWVNDTLISFELDEGDKLVRVWPEPSSSTESLDAILFSTGYVSPDNSPPITRLADQVQVNRSYGDGLDFYLDVIFNNRNLSFGTNDMSRTSNSFWNLTFNDNDRVELSIGLMRMDRDYYSSMLLALENTANDSTADVNLTLRFPSVSAGAYIDSGCTIAKTHGLLMDGRLWLGQS